MFFLSQKRCYDVRKNLTIFACKVKENFLIPLKELQLGVKEERKCVSEIGFLDCTSKFGYIGLGN